MKGLDLARGLWEEYGKPAMDTLPGMEYAAVGLCGAGSDCLGYDDDTSRDHDWGPGFMVFLPEAAAQQYGFALSKAYDSLPAEYKGYKVVRRSRMGDTRWGVKKLEGYFRPFTGTDGAPESWQQWLYTPSWAMAQAVSGQVFQDNAGEFTRIREVIAHGMPEDVRKKKIAARAALMAQSGQYNLARCRKHGEEGATRLAAAEFVRESIHMAFLLNNRHMPYYKWALRALEELPKLSEMKPLLEEMLLHAREETAEAVAGQVIAELKEQDLTHGSWDYLEPHAKAVTERIRNPEIAALHWMEG